MTPAELRTKAPQVAAHYDIENGQSVFYKVNNLGYTMRYSGSWTLAIGLNINNCRRL